MSVVWLAPAVLATISQVVGRRLNGEPAASLRELIWSGGDWLVYSILTPAVFWVSRRWPIERPHLTRRAILHLGVAVLFCVGWATGGKLLELALRLIFDIDSIRTAAAAGVFWTRLGLDLAGWILVTLPFGVVVYLSIAGMAHAIRYFEESRDRETQVARMAEQLAGARFAALQAQVNPHFLFNTLNTIAVLVRDNDRTAAVAIVEQLSDVLRRTLSRHRANEVRLEDELDLVRQYLEIERARFSDRLRPAFDLDAGVLSAAVPGFAVQHLVENAIRHGIARRPDAGLVRVAARRDGDWLEVSVTDDGPGIVDTAVDRKGHGIDNTRERLSALYGGRGTLTLAPNATGGTVATLRVPYRELPLETEHAPA